MFVKKNNYRWTKADKLEIEMRRVQHEYESLKIFWYGLQDYIGIERTATSVKKSSRLRNSSHTSGYKHYILAYERTLETQFYPIDLPLKQLIEGEFPSEISWTAHHIWSEILKVKESAIDYGPEHARAVMSDLIFHIGDVEKSKSLFGQYGKEYSNTRKNLVQRMIVAYCEKLKLVQSASKPRSNDGEKAVRSKSKKERIPSSRYIPINEDAIERWIKSCDKKERVIIIGFDYDYVARQMNAIVKVNNIVKLIPAADILLNKDAIK